MKRRIKDYSRGNPLGQLSISINARGSAAFTSIELLVVIAVLAVLTAIWLPALAQVKERDVRITCMNNEKQLYTSLHIYSDDNGDQLPRLDGVGSWPWDVPSPITTAMLKNGCTQKTFYCPSTAPRFTDQQNWAEANSLWNYGGGSFSIIGYAFSFGGTSSKIALQYQNLIIRSEIHTTVAPPVAFMDDPETRELLADVILSQGNSLPASAANNFTSIFSGFTQNGVSYPHLSAHVRTGGVPAGGNITYKDGHVQWRKFSASSSSSAGNTSKVRTGGTAPYFWW